MQLDVRNILNKLHAQMYVMNDEECGFDGVKRIILKHVVGCEKYIKKIICADTYNYMCKSYERSILDIFR